MKTKYYLLRIFKSLVVLSVIGVLMHLLKDVDSTYTIIGAITLIVIFAIIEKRWEKKNGPDYYSKSEKIVEGIFFGFWLFVVLIMIDLIEGIPITFYDILFAIVMCSAGGLLYGFVLESKVKEEKT